MKKADNLAKKDPLGILLMLVAIILVTGSAGLYFGSRFDILPLRTLGHVIIITGGLWMICRTYVLFLWRKYPWEEYPVLHIILEVVGIAIFTSLYAFALYRVEVWLGFFEPAENIGMQAFITILITFLITAIHELIYFYNQWIMNFSRSVKLEKDSIAAKYETLKTQINPHFLFNSLNSLVNMVDDNPKAVDYIQNLSEFLRYMLANRDKDLVYLKDELQVLNNYFELQKSRFGDNLRIESDVPEKYSLYTIPPLVLQMLVENCIKHNIISREKPLKIHLYVKKDYMFVKNNLQRKTEVDSTGQGIKNIRERYRYFTGKEVSVKENENDFIVSVPLIIMDI